MSTAPTARDLAIKMLTEELDQHAGSGADAAGWAVHALLANPKVLRALCDEQRYGEQDPWHDAALDAWWSWDRFKNARTPIEQADAVIAMNSAMSDLGSWLPGYDSETGTIRGDDDD